MVEREDHAHLTTFFAGEAEFAPDATVTLGADVARHARVLRIEAGADVRLVDGAGRRAACTVLRVGREAVSVCVGNVEVLPPPPPVHLLVPIADRDRMLWLAEKCAELGITSWRPVLWRRSRSVRPRGEGPTFASKVRLRMQAALEQSSGGYLPMIYPEATLDHAIAAVPDGGRIALDASGPPLLSLAIVAPVTLAVGPEGGMASDEVEALDRAGFMRGSLASAILRFETAAVAGVAIARASMAAHPGEGNGS